jgi:hypothetical protein
MGAGEWSRRSKHWPIGSEEGNGAAFVRSSFSLIDPSISRHCAHLTHFTFLSLSRLDFCLDFSSPLLLESHDTRPDYARCPVSRLPFIHHARWLPSPSLDFNFIFVFVSIVKALVTTNNPLTPRYPRTALIQHSILHWDPVLNRAFLT